MLGTLGFFGLQSQSRTQQLTVHQFRITLGRQSGGHYLSSCFLRLDFGFKLLGHLLDPKNLFVHDWIIGGCSELDQKVVYFGIHVGNRLQRRDMTFLQDVFTGFHEATAHGLRCVPDLSAGVFTGKLVLGFRGPVSYKLGRQATQRSDWTMGIGHQPPRSLSYFGCDTCHFGRDSGCGRGDLSRSLPHLVPLRFGQVLKRLEWLGMKVQVGLLFLLMFLFLCFAWSSSTSSGRMCDRRLLGCGVGNFKGRLPLVGKVFPLDSFDSFVFRINAVNRKIKQDAGCYR